MFEIKGKYNTARCYASNIEESAISQIVQMCNMPFTEGQSIAIMPDAHAGKGCTIGTTMTVKDVVCPNLVGVDLSCGMLTVDLGVDNIDLKKVDEACHNVPSGFNVWEGRKKRFNLQEISCYRHLNDTKRIERSIGTLGGGNHFQEIDRSENGNLYLIIHSGSRNLGIQLADFHQKIAVELHEGKEEYFIARENLIKEYKAAGRRTEIQAALKELEYTPKEIKFSKELAWLYGQWLDDYMNDCAIANEFAKLNRETMAEEICKYIGIEPLSMFHTVHNYVNTDDMVLRKGAISAKKDEVVLIPLNMRDGSIIAKGRGNKDWNNSGPHGAGRKMSRSDAKDNLSLEEFEEQMKDVYTTSVCQSTLDEAPGAYKSKDDIIKDIAEAVDIIEVMKPIYNFKAH